MPGFLLPQSTLVSHAGLDYSCASDSSFFSGSIDADRDGVMIDLETLGTSVSSSAMFQIGAVRFRNFTPVGEPLDIRVQVTPDRLIDPDTADWWHHADRRSLFERLASGPAKTPRESLRELAAFIGNQSVWAWPARFDLGMLSSYAIHHAPGFLGFIDPLRSFDGRSWSNGFARMRMLNPKRDQILTAKPPFPGDEHDAVFDCLWTLWCLRELRRAVGLE